MPKERKNKTQLNIIHSMFSVPSKRMKVHGKYSYFSRNSIKENTNVSNRITIIHDLMGALIFLLFLLSVPSIIFFSLNDIYIYLSLYTMTAYAGLVQPLARWIHLSMVKDNQNPLEKLNLIEGLELIFISFGVQKKKPSWNPFPNWNPPWLIRVIAMGSILGALWFIPYIVIEQTYETASTIEIYWAIIVGVMVGLLGVIAFILTVFSPFSRIEWRGFHAI